MKTFGVTYFTDSAPHKCCVRTDRWTTGVDPLLDEAKNIPTQKQQQTKQQSTKL